MKDAIGIKQNQFLEYIDSIKVDQVEITRRRAKSISLDNVMKIAKTLIT